MLVRLGTQDLCRLSLVILKFSLREGLLSFVQDFLKWTGPPFLIRRWRQLRQWALKRLHLHRHLLQGVQAADKLHILIGLQCYIKSIAVHVFCVKTWRISSRWMKSNIWWQACIWWKCRNEQVVVIWIVCMVNPRWVIVVQMTRVEIWRYVTSNIYEGDLLGGGLLARIVLPLRRLIDTLFVYLLECCSFDDDWLCILFFIVLLLLIKLVRMISSLIGSAHLGHVLSWGNCWLALLWHILGREIVWDISWNGQRLRWLVIIIFISFGLLLLAEFGGFGLVATLRLKDLSASQIFSRTRLVGRRSSLCCDIGCISW